MNLLIMHQPIPQFTNNLDNLPHTINHNSHAKPRVTDSVSVEGLAVKYRQYKLTCGVQLKRTLGISNMSLSYKIRDSSNSMQLAYLRYEERHAYYDTCSVYDPSDLVW